MLVRVLKTTGKTFVGWATINAGLLGYIVYPVQPRAFFDFMCADNPDTTEFHLNKYNKKTQFFMRKLFEETSRTVTVDEDTNVLHIKWQYPIKPPSNI